MATILGNIRTRLDSWKSALTGLGTRRDKLTSFRFERGEPIPDEVLEGLYIEDDSAAKICESRPKRMLRGRLGIHVEGEKGPDIATAIGEQLKDLKAREALLKAMIWENVFGGGAVFIGAVDGRNVNEPLDLDNVEAVRFLNVLDKRDLIPWTWYTDPLAGKLGEVATYKLQRLMLPGMQAQEERERKHRTQPLIEIHASRLLVFDGLPVTWREKIRNRGWGASRLARAYRALQIFNANWASVGHILQDASQGVFKMEGLIDMIASGNKQQLLDRMELVDEARSVARALLLDAEMESFERKDTTMSGLPEVLDRTAQRLASAAETPVTLFFGREPSGLNATGDADFRGWYDTIAAERDETLLPAVEYLVKILFRAKEGPTGGKEPDSWSVVFPPLWTPTAKEEAEIQNIHAQADNLRIQSGVLTAEEVAISRYRPEGYSNEIRIDLGPRKEALKAYEQQLASGEGDLPAIPTVPNPPTPKPGDDE